MGWLGWGLLQVRPWHALPRTPPLRLSTTKAPAVPNCVTGFVAVGEGRHALAPTAPKSCGSPPLLLSAVQCVAAVQALQAKLDAQALSHAPKPMHPKGPGPPA